MSFQVKWNKYDTNEIVNYIYKKLKKEYANSEDISNIKDEVIFNILEFINKKD